ncbi:MAG: class I SAM-dependent methyltransferase [Rickettsiales bacterium]|jgi:SAM-dependent methyltransferase|nr:class I SAM-dependent methyltransferase [Rickettsiales bacterium]
MASTERQNTLKAYDAIAPLYAEYAEKYRAYLSAVDQLVIQHLRADMRLLDVGSGDGRRIKAIAGHHSLGNVVCVEPSAQMAALCRSNTGFAVHCLCADALDTINEHPFDVATALWNVFGHMENSSVRLSALTQIARKLKPDGIFMLDVNNRHNQRAYGRWNVLKRRVIDALAFDETRGDARFEWDIGGQKFPATGHLFTPTEIESLFAKAGFRMIRRASINYRSGAVSSSPFDGQLFYVLGRLHPKAGAL